jgi:outer membrane receptor protein involved in Fe transport
MRFCPMIGLILLLGFAGGVAAQESSRLDLVVFRGGVPVSGMELRANGDTLGETDQQGALSASIPAGDQRLSLHDDGEQLGRLNLRSQAGRPVQVIANLPASEDGEVAFDIEGAQQGVARADAGDTDEPTGSLSGQVLSAEDQSPVSGAQVYFAGVDTRVTTDEEGRFRAELPAGEYQLSVVHPDYSTRTRSDVKVAADQDAQLELDLTPAGLRLADVTVTAPHVEGSVASVFSQQREGSGVSEVLGAEQMARSGDSTAADALKRVTGLTIEDGKYVVVRGQPARYTKTLWNGSPLPSPDPIRRIVPLDLFPTGTLSRINVQKSYDPQVPGSFGGGLIGLETAGVPEEDFLEVSLSGGMNTQTTGKQGLNYEGGGTDIRGTDDGTRAIPAGVDNNLDEAAGDFPNIWAVEEQSMGPDTGFGVSGGKSGEALDAQLGVRADFSWSRSFDYRETIERDYALAGDDRLVVRNDQVEKRTDMNVDLGGMFTLSAEWDDHELRSNTFFIRKAVKRSQITEGTRVVSDNLFIRDYLLEWNERELFAQQFTGDHEWDWVKAGWRALLAEGERSSPDRRSYIYRRQSNGEFVFFDQAKANRRFNESRDDITALDADLEFPLLDGPRWQFSLHTGVSTYTQDRESQTRRFSFETQNDPDLSDPPEILLNPARVGDTLEVSDETQTNDSYLGSANVDGTWFKLDLDWNDTIRLMAGARRESADFNVETFVAGGSAGGQSVQAGFQKEDVLPAASLTWSFLEDMQVRLSTSTTISRPVLNELSPARYYDPDTGEEYLGNPDLEPASIDSFDARWEWYPSPQESISLGFFSKEYTNAIEQSFVGVGGSALLRQVQNAAGATVSGTEASARVSLDRLVAPLGFGGTWAPNSYVQANASFINSQVELAQQDLATNKERPLQGQADSVFNLQAGYEGERHDFNVSWNLVGERLHLAGVQGQPDVYQQPVPQLDVNYSVQWTESLKTKLSAGNLLDPEIEFTQGGRIFRQYTKGVDFGASLSWEF